MTVQHVVVNRLFLGIIVPVEQGDVLRDRLRDARIHFAVLGVVLAARGQTEEHVAPQHRMQAVLIRKLIHTAEMVKHDLHAVVIAVLVEVPSKAHQMGLVHTDVDPARAQAGRELTEHRTNQLVRLFLPGQQNIVQVVHVAERRPAHYLTQMGERLDRGHQLNAEAVRVIVHPPQILRRVAAAAPAEIRIIRQLVHILDVQLQHGVAHARETHDKTLEAVAVEHRSA